LSPDDTPPVWHVPLADVRVDAAVTEAAADALASGWWSMGPRVAAFEEAFAAYVGSRHAISVANGTAALQLALLAAGCGPGDEVIVPSLTFVAAANAVAHTGARPVFCDIRSLGDLNLDPFDVEACVTARTKAIVPVHYGGYACDTAALAELAGRHDLVVIEDAAHALGARSEGRACGTLGKLGCFSFFANKNLPMGEGGMVVTDDDEAAATVKLLRSHGMTSVTWDRHTGHATGYDVVAQGFNYRLDELHAAIGLAGLAGLDAGNAARADIVRRYREAFAESPRLTMPFAEAEPSTSAHHLAVIVVAERDLQDEVRAHLRSRGVQTSLHYPPIHRFSAYADAAGRRLPLTEDASFRLVTLPLFPHQTDEQVDLVVTAVLEAVGAD
jgi:dTDP-4-amino-4,6-dideoxygalactose transaminase